MTERRPPTTGLREYATELNNVGLAGLAHKVTKRVGGTFEERLKAIKELGLPVEPSISVTMKDFDDNPEKYFDELVERLDGYCPKTYYAALIAGRVRAMGASREELIDFIRDNRQNFPDDYSFSLKSNDHAFSGCLDTDKDGILSGTFVLGPYHRLTTGESVGDLRITENKFGSGTPELAFTGGMGGGNPGDYRNDNTKYKTYTGSTITKMQMAEKVLVARDLLKQAIGVERGRYIPNMHCRVVFVDSEYGYKPYFIKAVQSDI
ncbi:hypothetical protein FWC31_02405 [Candidatus Saccharibacteria bacterium]|nr:hypothetical protein [Candidatus Saccharibacteria bacterium]